MTRRSTFAKKQAEQFSGKRNPGVIKVLTHETSWPTTVDEGQNLGLGLVQNSLPEPILSKESTCSKKISSNLDIYNLY